MTDDNRSVAGVFTKLRDRLFHDDLSKRTGTPNASEPTGSEVLGVAMELGLDAGSALVFGLRDGSASMYFSTGGGMIGGQGRPHINAAAKRLVEVAHQFVVKLPRVEEYPLPRKGSVRFSIFTPSGVHAADADNAELTRGRGELLPLFAAANEIMTGFRLVEQIGMNNESSYVNCLLTTLARGSAESTSLLQGTHPPDPASLTAEQDDLEWIAELGFTLDRLSTDKIIDMFLKLAGFRWFRFGKTEGVFRAKLAAPGGGLTDVSFRILRRRREGRTEVEVHRIAS